MRSLNWLKGLTYTAAVAICCVLVSCGGGKDSSPAPAPSTPAPAPAPTPINTTVPGTNCPLNATGVPLQQNGQPIFGSLQSTQSGYWGSQNSLTLALSFVNYTGPGSWVQNVVGSGAFVFPDIGLLLGNYTNTNSNVCVTSNNIGSTGSNPGTYSMGNGAISMSLSGVVQVPLYNPYTSYPGYYPPNGNQMGQETIRINIGINCAAYISNNRLVGCVSVRLGNSPYGRVLNYYSR